MLKRYTPLKRTQLTRSQKPIRKVKLSRAIENAQYSRDRLEYLDDHPWCQVTIFMLGLNEAEVIANYGGYWSTGGIPLRVPHGVTIHHRNKCRGARKNDRRFWISSSFGMHEMIEQNKRWAREIELLLPMEADENGLCPNGRQYLETPALLAKKEVQNFPK
jgi:hypothetical protein